MQYGEGKKDRYGNQANDDTHLHFPSNSQRYRRSGRKGSGSAVNLRLLEQLMDCLYLAPFNLTSILAMGGNVVW